MKLSTSFAALAVALSLSIPANGAEPADFNLPEIPSQLAWPNEVVEFTFVWEEHPNALIEVTVDPQPAGVLTVTRDAGRMLWVFRYETSPLDGAPFQVQFHAVYANESMDRVIEVIPVKPANSFVLGTEPGDPSANSLAGDASYYISTETDGGSSLLIVGQNVTLQGGQPNGIYDQVLANVLNSLYGTIEIIGTEVTIASPILSKGADVIIYAETLHFVDDGRISTQPDGHIPARISETKSLDGEDGLLGGHHDHG